MSNFLENLKIECRHSLVPISPPKIEILAVALENWTKSAFNFPCKSYFTSFAYTFVYNLKLRVSNWRKHNFVY